MYHIRIVYHTLVRLHLHNCTTFGYRVPVGIGPNTTISNTIVDKNCRVGADCTLVNKDGVHEMDRPEEGLYIRDGIVIVTKGSEVPNGTVI